MIVVAKDFVGSARIQNGEQIDSPQDFLQLAGEDLTAPLLAESIQPLLQSLLNGAGERFPGFFCDLSSQSFRLYVLYAKCHSNISIPYYITIYTSLITFRFDGSHAFLKYKV